VTAEGSPEVFLDGELHSSGGGLVSLAPTTVTQRRGTESRRVR
jgi:hypothetical protein